MKTKLKKFLIPFILMVVTYVNISSGDVFELGFISPHVGILFVSGLLFGPYGALGATLANLIIDLHYGYTPNEAFASALVSFGVSYLSYKIWYSGFRGHKITKPKLDNTHHITLFLLDIIICSFIYGVAHGNMLVLMGFKELGFESFNSYSLNFANIAFILGINSVWISRKLDFVDIPKKSGRKVNDKLYAALFCLLIITTLIASMSLVMDIGTNIIFAEVMLIIILLFLLYLYFLLV